MINKIKAILLYPVFGSKKSPLSKDDKMKKLLRIASRIVLCSMVILIVIFKFKDIGLQTLYGGISSSAFDADKLIQELKLGRTENRREDILSR